MKDHTTNFAEWFECVACLLTHHNETSMVHSTAWVSNWQPTSLNYAAHSHVCKLCT